MTSNGRNYPKMDWCGTGKTPFTIYLAEKFTDRDKKVAIVSRGYGRRSKGFHLVSDGIHFKAKVEVHGDEPVLLARRLPGVIVAVSEERNVAISYILKNYDVDVILLDDGFQHRSVGRNLDIVLQKDEKKFKNKLVLPAGLLREFKFNLKRADLLISADIPTEFEEKRKFFSESKIDDVLDICFKTHGSLKELIGLKCIAFAGIAHPEYFKQNLVKEGITLAHFAPFRDHHNFSKDDLYSLIKLCRINESKFLLCTEKDLVKISELSEAPQILKDSDVQLLAARLNVKVKNEEDFLQKVKYLS